MSGGDRYRSRSSSSIDSSSCSGRVGVGRSNISKSIRINNSSSSIGSSSYIRRNSRHTSTDSSGKRSSCSNSSSGKRNSSSNSSSIEAGLEVAVAVVVVEVYAGIVVVEKDVEHDVVVVVEIFSISAVVFFHCEAFMLGTRCQAPCTCSTDGYTMYIYCNAEGLNTTPHFLKENNHFLQLSVQLYWNHLTTIPNYAFKNLSALNATSVEIAVGYNKISTIDKYAFYGIENVTTKLELQNNSLTRIPMAVYNLSALKTLYIQGNPLNSLGALSQSEISNTLQTLKIDLKEFTSWPNELGSLHTLKSFTVSNLHFTHLDSDAFRGFEHSLTTLDMQYAAKFEKIPTAVCQLSNLQRLFLRYFTKLNENSTSIFDHCTKKLNKVKVLFMRDSKLTTFPDVFHIFPSLNIINLGGNSLRIIESAIIPTNNFSSYINIYLQSNKFTSIPNALNKLKGLTALDLSYNDISSVEDHDLNGLVHLERLILSNNPIKYISTHAFRNNNALTTLDLRRTSLKSVPAAVVFLPNLSSLDLRTTDPIPCTCEMSYLKGWNATAVRTFYGQCAYPGVKIQSFVMSSLQQCP
ncbi:leucine-rich repeat-containing protein 40-like [Mercenaria mercenaria]|uniref:leucine-rich repeat-containing protein 40-like n=1 Tax=Mercenaria mercenaria TaxID=6596 RepID=UPI00234F54C3|nr:leucine-rich repeat-containing protein 40-like [Mercenaria mercenaria]